jgi:hypothetical protein
LLSPIFGTKSQNFRDHRQNRTINAALKEPFDLARENRLINLIGFGQWSLQDIEYAG